MDWSLISSSVGGFSRKAEPETYTQITNPSCSHPHLWSKDLSPDWKAKSRIQVTNWLNLGVRWSEWTWENTSHLPRTEFTVDISTTAQKVEHDSKRRTDLLACSLTSSVTKTKSFLPFPLLYIYFKLNPFLFGLALLSFTPLLWARAVKPKTLPAENA